ncbi:hypothetical protein ABPG72_010910 [Tetrahymena utriculariae]
MLKAPRKIFNLNLSRNIQNNQQKRLFYCIQCQEDDFDYKPSNYILISTLIKKGAHQIIAKWPPVQDNSVFQEFSQQLNLSSEDNQFEVNIENQFNKLKNQIIEKLDKCKKNMLIKARTLLVGNQKVLNQYQELSQIFDLKYYLEQPNAGIKQQSLTVKIQSKG